MKDNPFSFTSHLIPRTPSIPPPPPPTANNSIYNRINRRNSTLTRTPNISFSLPDSFAQSSDYIPITIDTNPIISFIFIFLLNGKEYPKYVNIVAIPANNPAVNPGLSAKYIDLL